MNSLYQLRLMVSLQNQASSGLTRIGRDIRTLGAATEQANRRQFALAQKAATQQLAIRKTEERLNNMTNGTGSIQNLIRQSALSEKGTRIALRENTLLQRKATLLTGIRGKENQLLDTQDKIQKLTTGSGNLRNMVRATGLQNQGLAIARQMETAIESQNTHQKSLYRNKANQLKLEQKLMGLGLTGGRLDKVLQQTTFGNFPKSEAFLNSLKAARIEAAQLERQIAAIPALVAETTAKELALTQQERLQVALVREHAQAIMSANAEFSKQQMELANIEARLASITGEYELLAKQTETLTLEEQKRLISLREQAVAVGHVTEELRLQNAALGETVRLQALAAAEAAKGRVQRIEQVGRGIGHVGRTATLVGAIGTATAVGTSAAAANFDRLVTTAATQSTNRTKGSSGDPSEIIANSKKISTAILHDMTLFPASAEQMAKASYDIYSSMNVSFGQGMGLLKKFNEVAVAGNTDLDTATNASITVLNNFATKGGSVNSVLNTMFATVRFGRMNFAQFNKMLNQVAPAAAATGQSLVDVAGAMALITTRQPSQQQSATGISRLLQTLTQTDVQIGLQKFGVSVKDAQGNMRSLFDIISQIHSKKDLRNADLFNIFQQLSGVGRGGGRGNRSTIQASRSLVFLIKNFQAYQDIQKKVTGDTKEFDRSLAALGASPGVRWQVFMNQMHVFIIMIGQEALPVILKFGEHIANLIHWFQNLSSHTRHMIVVIGVVASVFTLIGGVIATIIGPMIALAANFRLLTMGLGAKGGLNSRLFSLTRMLGFLMRVGTIAIGIKLITKGDKGIKGFFEKVGGAGLVGGGLFGLPGAIIGAAGTAIGIGGRALDDKLHGNSKDIFAAIIKHRRDVQTRSAQLMKSKNPIYRGIGQHLADNTSQGFADLLKSKHINAAANWVDKYLTLVGVKVGKLGKGKKGKAGDTFTDMWLKAGQAAVADALKSQKLLDQYNAGLGGTTDNTSAVQRAAERAQAVTDAATKAIDQIKTKLQTLSDAYNKFRDANKNVLGDIFTPPQDSFGLNIVSGIYSNLAKFGVVPPASLIAKITTARVEAFKKADANFTALRKRGASQAFIDSLKGLGDQGVIIAKSLVQGPRGALRTVLKNFNLGQKLVEKASTVDFTNALKHWKSYGERAADAIVQGLLSKDKGLAAQFKNVVLPKVDEVTDAWIKKTFPEVIAKAEAAAKTKFDKLNPVKPKKPTLPAGGTGGGGKGPHTTVNNNDTTHYHVYGFSHQSVEAAQAKEAFRRKAKRRAGRPSPAHGGGGGGFG